METTEQIDNKNEDEDEFQEKKKPQVPMLKPYELVYIRND